MYGLPTETEGDMLKTFEFMKKLNPPYAGLGLYAPLPNTQLWDEGMKLGLLNPGITIAHFFEVNPKDYFFKDYKKRMAGMEYEKFMRMARHLMRGFNKHNMRWANIAWRAWSRRKIYNRDFNLMVKDIKKAFKWLTG